VWLLTALAVSIVSVLAVLAVSIVSGGASIYSAHLPRSEHVT
jgi:hypothetical protein